MIVNLKLVILLDKFLPFIGPIKRFFIAFYDTYSPLRKSYSQYGEDILIEKGLEGITANDAIYVDVGANHPTRISNTYLLYKKGWSGITVEPNAALLKLHRLFRKRDIQVNVGCGNKSSLLRFYVSRTPVLSSFIEQEVKHLAVVKYLPIMTIDELLEPFKDKEIALLSIDTEGFDLNVLLGAINTLKRTKFVCFESNNDFDESKKIALLLAENFEHCATLGCNEVFKFRG
ncbi:MAG: FkbM family methyltransferase [Chlorobium sp.]|nr:MAG: FkbM family methyltransferase [Chlorobium sp.]